MARHYLNPLKESGVDTVILGCTHYPLLKPAIKAVMGKSVTLIDSAKQVAIEVNNILADNNLLSKNGKGKRNYFVSDNPEWFGSLARRFIGGRLDNVKKVNNV